MRWEHSPAHSTRQLSFPQKSPQLSRDPANQARKSAPRNKLGPQGRRLSAHTWRNPVHAEVPQAGPDPRLTEALPNKSTLDNRPREGFQTRCWTTPSLPEIPMAPQAPSEQALRRQECSPHAVSSHVSGGSSRDTPVSLSSRPLLRSQDTTASSLNSCGPSPTFLRDPGCPHPKRFPHSSHHLLTGLPPSCHACDPAVTWRPTQHATLRAAGGKAP